MFRAQMPRIFELVDLVPDRTSPGAYFQNFEENLASSTHIGQTYLRREKELQGLDDRAWGFLKCEALRYLTHKDPKGRGWQQLFDILNQARAYNYLKANLGCSMIRFIPRANNRGKTPDLDGVLASGGVLCEVKTINISNDELRARGGCTSRTSTYQLDVRFLQKLSRVIASAKEQLSAYSRGRKDRYLRHIVYINLNFDDILGEYKVRHFELIDQYLSDNPVAGIELVFHNDVTPFHNAVAMSNAEVFNACEADI